MDLKTAIKDFTCRCKIYLGTGEAKSALVGLAESIVNWEYVSLETEEETFFPEINFITGISPQALDDIRALMRHCLEGRPCTLEVDTVSADNTMGWRHTFVSDGLKLTPIGQNMADKLSEVATLSFNTNSESLFEVVPVEMFSIIPNKQL